MTCPWCGAPILPRLRRHGSPQGYCSTKCRHALGTALRRWAMLEFEARRVTSVALKAVMGRGEESAHASNAEPISPVSLAPDRAPESAHALCEPLCHRGATV